MEHPFLSSASLADKSLDDLQSNITMLTNKLNYVYRTGDQNMINQLVMVIESYRTQYNSKMDVILKKQFTSKNLSQERINVNGNTT